MALGSVEGTRLVASRTEKCWTPSVSRVTIGPFGPFGRLWAQGDHVPSAATPATPAAAPRNFRRSMRTSSMLILLRLLSPVLAEVAAADAQTHRPAADYPGQLRPFRIQK